MILVTLGTHPKPMDRLIAAVDLLVDDGTIDEDVVITAATIGRPSRHGRVEGVVSFDQLRRWASDARAIISHGGPASIMLALAAGHAPIVVPRDPRLGEHVDDHQIRFARWLAERRPITVVEDIERLGPAVRSTLAGPSIARMVGARPDQAIDYLRALTERGL